MILLRRIAAFCVPALIALLLYVGFVYHPFFLYGVLISVVLLTGTVLWIARVPKLSRDMGMYLVTPAIFLSSLIGLILVLESSLLRGVIVAVGMILELLYLETLFTYFYNRIAYQTHALTNISSYVNIISMFLVGVNVFGSLALVQLPLWLLSLIIVVATGLMTTQTFWLHSIATKENYLYSIFVTVIMLEFAWALIFLPNNFYVNAILLVIGYYVIWGISRAHLLNLLSRNLLLRYLIIGALMTALIVATSQWT